MPSLPKESWNFSLNDYPIQHQGIHVIDLNISYDYRAGLGATNPYEYPNFLPVAAFIKDFLVNYPNEGDFWEIVSRKLVETLLTDPIPTPYGIDYRLAEMVDRVSISLTVHPDAAIPYTRSSFVEQEVLVGTVGVDHLNGGFYGDAIRGDAGNDWLRGLDGDDYLSGGSGNDRLFGGQGNDILAGGAGADRLTGGDGSDIFLFAGLADLDGTDRILDFMHAEGDKIDLSGIDAVVGSGNDAFTLVASFSGIAGELMVQPWANNQVVVRGDLDGNGIGDFQIRVTTPTPLSAGDFIL